MALRLGFADSALVSRIGPNPLTLFSLIAMLFVLWGPCEFWLGSRRESPLATAIARLIEAQPIRSA